MLVENIKIEGIIIPDSGSGEGIESKVGENPIKEPNRE